MAPTIDELLSAVDVVGRAREGLIDRDMNGKRGYVGRSDDAPDGKARAELIAARESASPEIKSERNRRGFNVVSSCL